MIVAEIQLTIDSYGTVAAIHSVYFDELFKAAAEYERIAALLKGRGDRRNDLPSIIELQGSHNKVSIALDRIAAISLCDYVVGNEMRAGVRGAFPNLFKK